MISGPKLEPRFNQEDQGHRTYKSGANDDDQNYIGCGRCLDTGHKTFRTMGTGRDLQGIAVNRALTVKLPRGVPK